MQYRQRNAAYMKYRKNQDVGLFDKESTLLELLENGNPLPKLKEIIDFEQFRGILEPVFDNTRRKSNAGRKPLSGRLMGSVCLDDQKVNK